MSAMTDLLARSVARVPGRPPGGGHPRPAPVGALLAAGWAVLAGALPCAAIAVVGWFATTGGTASWAFRVGVDAWLSAHWVPIALSDGRYHLAPWGLTALPVLLLWRAGGWVARTAELRGGRDTSLAVASLAVAYGALVTLVALATRADEAAPDLVRAFAFATLLAAVVGGAGTVRETGHAKSFWERLPEGVRAVLYGGTAGLVALLTCGTLLVAVSLVVHAGRVADLTRSLAPGPVGLVLLLVACLAYLPNAAVFGAAYALGPGFAVGTGTVVAPSGVLLGSLPAFPLLGALPVTTTPPGWLAAVLLLPIAAGAVAGLAAVRRYPEYGVETAATRAGLAGVAGGVLYTLVALLAGGSVGPGRLADVGPPAAQTALIAISTLGIAGAVAVLASRAAARWHVLDRLPGRRREAATEQDAVDED
ncbi:cell division protein PerM [Actinopolymorpha rutila]|uniref:Uncharacterized protein n=1 Tax=Actinopolymorpha rutila TaxID=446787 RepID=A0A852ZIM8_9ACTN|nr:DUF6350 family protein [Actinopolymorpha rutila]NYH91758.1 hypothetical protein [Actinopolymorpha rutila]